MILFIIIIIIKIMESTGRKWGRTRCCQFSFVLAVDGEVTSFCAHESRLTENETEVRNIENMYIFKKMYEIDKTLNLFVSDVSSLLYQINSTTTFVKSTRLRLFTRMCPIICVDGETVLCSSSTELPSNWINDNDGQEDGILK
jgi:hypothetical protein